MDFEGMIAQALHNIYTGTAGDVEENLYALTAETLSKGIDKGFVSVAWNTPNYEFSSRLKKSALWFSANKSFHQASALAALLDDGNGSKITWSQFVKKAAPIVGQYNMTWLRTEYNTAIRSARMTSLWKGFEENKDLYPNLRFVRTRSATPRKEHLEYVGITRPLDDKFWVNHYPPIDYNCKCSVEPTADAVTPVPGKLPKPVPGLDNNPALTGKLFSDNHPFIASTPKKNAVKIRRMVQQSMASLNIYTQVYKAKGAGKVLVHLAAPAAELAYDVEVSKRLADLGKVVEILPLNQDNDVKNPDVRVDGVLADFKEPVGKSTHTGVQNAIKKASKQGVQTAIIILAESDTPDDIYRGLKGAIRGKKGDADAWNASIDNVWIMLPDRLVELSREQILSGDLAELFR